MLLKSSIVVLALLNGGWMLFDGIHVLRKGKYFGPPEPGPWSAVVKKVGINPLALGPVFVGVGVVWLIAALGVASAQPWAWSLALTAAIGTLWYVPVGAVLSLFSIALLTLSKGS